MVYHRLPERILFLQRDGISILRGRIRANLLEQKVLVCFTYPYCDYCTYPWPYTILELVSQPAHMVAPLAEKNLHYRQFGGRVGLTISYQGSIVPLVLLSVLWLFMTTAARITIRNGNVQAHRMFMIRSYTLALSFVFLRILADLVYKTQFAVLY